MSASYKKGGIKVKSIGKTVTIPKNDIARLMYYLSCVDTVINYGEDILSDYQHYNLLTPKQKEVLLKLVEEFKPDIFINAGIFILDQSLIPNEFDNEFYLITDRRINSNISRQITVGGRNASVIKVMACNITWLNKFYYKPLENIYNMKKLIKHISQELLNPSNHSSKNYYNNNHSNNYVNNNSNNNRSNNLSNNRPNNYFNNRPNNNLPKNYANNNHSNNYSNNFTNNSPSNNYSNNFSKNLPNNNPNSYINKNKKEKGACCCLIW